MSTVKILKEAKALINQPNGWIINEAVHKNKDGTYAFCAQGAVSTCYEHGKINDAYSALASVLRRRWLQGQLPEPIYGGGGCRPRTWEGAFEGHGWYAIAQFNNSTSQAEVVALFDEAIADEEAKLAPLPLLDFTPKPVKAPVRERELELA